jgi:hypothetical protein
LIILLLPVVEAGGLTSVLEAVLVGLELGRHFLLRLGHPTQSLLVLVEQPVLRQQLKEAEVVELQCLVLPRRILLLLAVAVAVLLTYLV